MKKPQKLVQRSLPMKIVSYYLARCGVRPSNGPTRPPAALYASTWKDAYDTFFDAMADGRTPSQFRNSMKNSRDTFDILFENGRIGWIGRDQQEPSISTGFETIHEEWKTRSDEDLETFVFDLLINSETFDTKADFSHEARTEGGESVFVSTRPERDPKLRRMALAIHGYDCMACSFNFEKVFGEIGKGFIEVHHVVTLSGTGERETDPETDLVVLCANCHRMVHRRKGICLSLNELKMHIVR